MASASLLGRVAKLEMTVGSATDRRSEREAVILVAEGSAVRQRSAAIGEHSRRSKFGVERSEAVLETLCDGVNQ